MQKRVVSLWFPKLASNRILRLNPIDGPFALVHHEQNADRLYCLNKAAESAGLHPGMSFSDARAFCPELQSQSTDLFADRRFLYALARWARYYCPWVGLDGRDGLQLDISGCAHLFGGEEKMLTHMQKRLKRTGLQVRISAADTLGAAWALSHYAPQNNVISPPDKTLDFIKDLPIASLRLTDKDVISFRRLGVHNVGQMLALPRKNINRRFSPDVLEQLDKAMGWQSEKITPVGDPPHFGVRMNLPEPIGLQSDVMLGLERLLERLVSKLTQFEYGARNLRFVVRKVDQENEHVDLKLARPMRDPERLLKLFERGVGEIDAGFGIDQIQLRAILAEPLPVEQIGDSNVQSEDALDDLISRLGSRIGLDNIVRFTPKPTHIPEQGFAMPAAAWSVPVSDWPETPPRPLRFFAPEMIEGSQRTPPNSFRWRRMLFAVKKASGPERISPEWWTEDSNWRRGLRDYWRVETQQGQRLWLFFTPQNPAWFVHGEFI